jgi:glycosyltransferase involved in cell wall biosynthesis
MTVSSDTRRKILVIRSANVHETARALQHLRVRFPGAEICLLLPRHLMEHLAANPSIDRFLVYENRSNGSTWRRAVTLLRSLRKERFDEVVILCASRSRIVTLYDVILFSLFIPARRRVILDGQLTESDLSCGRRLKAVAHHFALLALSAVGALLTLLLLAWGPPSEGGRGSRSRRIGLARRIAILVPILPDISHTFVYREVLAMKRYGAEFIVIALEEGDYGVLHPEAKELRGHTLFAPKPSLIRYMLYYLFFTLRFPRRMAELIRLYQPYAGQDPLLFLRVDQYHNSLHPMHGVGLAWMLKRLGVSSLHVHGSTYPTTRAMAASCLLGIPFSTHAFVDFDFDYDFKMLQEKLARSAFFVTHTDFCRARLREAVPDLDPEKIHTVRIGVDPSQWRPALSRTEGHVSPASVRGGPRPMDSPERNRDDGRPALSLVAVCRFVEKKGLDVLLRACALLRGRQVPFRCLLIGDGPEMGRLQSLVAELHLDVEVTFVGPIPTDQVRSYLVPENVIIVPSVYARDGERDGTPTVLIEAMASGVPVIASDISGIPELIDHDENGILVPSRDDEKLAAAIHALFTQPDLRTRLGRSARRKILKEFDVRVNALRVWRLILRKHYPDVCLLSPASMPGR